MRKEKKGEGNVSWKMTKCYTWKKRRGEERHNTYKKISFFEFLLAISL
jgi:hypothetical protein